MDRPLSFGFPSVRLAVRSLWFLNSSGQTLAREPPCTPRLLVQQAARSMPYYLLFQLHNATASEWPQQGGQVVSRRKGSIGRWLAELLISPTGGCRPRGLRYVAGMLAHSADLPASGYGLVSPRRWNSSKALIFIILNALRFASSDPHQLKVTSQAGIDRSTFHSLARGVSHIDRVCASTQQRHSNGTAYLPHRVPRSSEVTTKPAVV
jgi:hypothetical protein